MKLGDTLLTRLHVFAVQVPTSVPVKAGAGGGFRGSSDSSPQPQSPRRSMVTSWPHLRAGSWGRSLHDAFSHQPFITGSPFIPFRPRTGGQKRNPVGTLTGFRVSCWAILPCMMHVHRQANLLIISGCFLACVPTDESIYSKRPACVQRLVGRRLLRV